MAESGTSWRQGLRFQFIIVTFVVLLFMVATFVISQLYIPYFFIRQVDEHNTIIAKAIAARIQQQLTSIGTGVENLAARPDIQSMDPEVQRPALTTAREINPIYTRVFVLDKDGNMILSIPDNPAWAGKNFGNAPYFRQPVETNKTYFSDAFVEANELLTIVATPIRGQDGNTIGTLNVSASLSSGKIPEFTSEIELGKGGYPILVDRRGSLIIHPDRRRVLGQENFRKNEAAQRVLSGQTGTVVCDVDGERRLCGFAPIKPVGWGLIITRPFEVVYPYLDWVRASMAALFLMGLGLIVFFFMHGRRNVLQPLETLTAGVRQVAQGDFDHQVRISGPVEMIDLAHAFNGMAQVLSTCYRVTAALNSLSSLKEIEDYVLEQMEMIFHTESAVIMRFVEDGQLKIVAQRGLPEEAVGAMNRVQVDRKMFGELLGADMLARLSGGQSVLVRGEEMPLFSKMNLPIEHVRHVYIFPLLIEGSLDGVLLAISSSEKLFAQERVQTVQSIAGHIAVAIQRSNLYDLLYQSYAQTTKAIARAIDAKDPYNQGHSEGVARTAVKISERMGLSADRMRGVEIAAYLHDVGKIGISEELLQKPAGLSAEEKDVVNRHPAIGATILEPIDFPWPVLEAIRSHHERFDGTGYPSHLTNAHIPLEGRILAVADAFESMMSDRPYRSALSKEELVTELIQGSGKQFDPDVVNELLAIIDEEGVDFTEETPTLEFEQRPKKTENSRFVWPEQEELAKREGFTAPAPEAEEPEAEEEEEVAETPDEGHEDEVLEQPDLDETKE